MGIISIVFGVVPEDDGPRRRLSDTIVVRMPQCELCAPLGRPKPIRVNTEEYHVTFVVNKSFSERVGESRQGEDR